MAENFLSLRLKAPGRRFLVLKKFKYTVKLGNFEHAQDLFVSSNDQQISAIFRKDPATEQQGAQAGTIYEVNFRQVNDHLKLSFGMHSDELLLIKRRNSAVQRFIVNANKFDASHVFCGVMNRNLFHRLYLALSENKFTKPFDPTVLASDS